jgi:hypothetical protein
MEFIPRKVGFSFPEIMWSVRQSARSRRCLCVCGVVEAYELVFRVEQQSVCKFIRRTLITRSLIHELKLNECKSLIRELSLLVGSRKFPLSYAHSGNEQKKLLLALRP